MFLEGWLDKRDKESDADVIDTFIIQLLSNAITKTFRLKQRTIFMRFGRKQRQ